uniref:Uncharacterized protein n=1 Tax=Rhizophora mucronata TaxID=61149 RepID=A0A2P2P746_RHIMU
MASLYICKVEWLWIQLRVASGYLCSARQGLCMWGRRRRVCFNTLVF